jgi:hypothetical protein
VSVAAAPGTGVASADSNDVQPVNPITSTATAIVIARPGTIGV